MSRQQEHATSFGSVAATYEHGRPEYPREAVHWLLEQVAAARPRVADVGAGTGKLTRAVQALGADVVAVDPDPDMLAQLVVAVPDVPAIVGTGEALPLEDASVDAVVYGQAWHWVDPIAASAEAGRVLRDGGVLGLVWNVRDERVEWVRRLTAIMHGSKAEEMIAEGATRVGAPFGPLETRAWSWDRVLTREQFRSMVASRSHVITASASNRARILAEVEALFDERTAGADTITLPYRTEAFRARRIDG